MAIDGRFLRVRMSVYSNILNWRARLVVRHRPRSSRTTVSHISEPEHGWRYGTNYDPIQRISGSFLGTGSGVNFGCPTIIGAMGRYAGGRSIEALPAGVPSHPCANPIQQVPSPTARAASIRFSAAREQSSTAQRLSAGLEITMSAGA